VIERVFRDWRTGQIAARDIPSGNRSMPAIAVWLHVLKRPAFRGVGDGIQPVQSARGKTIRFGRPSGEEDLNVPLASRQGGVRPRVERHVPCWNVFRVEGRNPAPRRGQQ
jgi:hypothetical protein